LESIHFYVKVPKTGGTKFKVTIGLRKGHDLAVRGERIVFRTQPCYTSKEAYFYVDFKNINLPL
jgi:hypothetical protein